MKGWVRATPTVASVALVGVLAGACGGSEFQGPASSTGGAGGDGTAGAGSSSSVGSGGAGCSNEVCNGVDDDCNGDVDDLPPKTCGRGQCENTVAACMDGEDNECEAKPAGTEICNGSDDDCDGEVDEADPELGDACRTGLRGGCAEGTKQCRSGQLVCIADTAVPETCNLVDDDCNGQVDDGITGGDCMTGLLGVCSAGTLSCVGGNMVCQPDQSASVESCNALDDDCDGSTDEGNPGGGVACDTGQKGVCADGTTVCAGGSIDCDPDVGPSSEICDGIDNDCDGASDENNPGGGGACNTGLLGECAIGVSTCNNGSLGCMQTKFSIAETCNGKDDDCDGSVDEGNPGGGNACNTGMPGVCSSGQTQCQNGAVACTPLVTALPSEICGNGLDDDCNGVGDPGGITTYFFDAFDQGNAKGWTLGNEWAINVAVGSVSMLGGYFGDPDVDHSPTANDQLAGMVIGGDVSNAIHPPYWLTSPVINTAAAAGSVWLEYWRWLNSDYEPFAVSMIEVYNGVSWVNVWKSPMAPGVADDEWFEHVIDITAHKNANMRIRFGYQVLTAGAFQLSGWNIDDVQVLSSPCP